MRVEYKMAQEWLEKFARELEGPIFSEWAHADVKAADLLSFTRTPYVAYWSFGEKLPVVDEGTKDPESLGFALETVTAILAQRFDGSEVLVQNRDAFVEAARRGAPTEDGLPLRQVGQGRPVRALIIYSPEDERFRLELDKHLSLLRKAGIVHTWSSRRIGAGGEWHGTVSSELEQATLVLFLVSADFLASDYAYGQEVERAMSRAATGQAHVLSILVRAVDWDPSPFRKFQVLPRDGQPIASWTNRDEAWADVARGIREAAEIVRSS
jgi:hypothetical protein